MKKLVILLGLACAASAWAQTYVKPHVRKDGTFVEGHYRSAPDSNPYNNYSTQGNTNPYTGERGTVNPYQQQPTYTPTYPSTPVCGIASNGQYVCR